MTTLRHVHQLMHERRTVQLSDGRVGKVVRVDTVFPANSTTVSVWTESSGPGISKVALTEVLGEVTLASA